MAIPIHNNKTGIVTLRNFDEGVVKTLGATLVVQPPGPTDQHRKRRDFTPGYRLDVPLPSGKTQPVNVYFSQPETAFRSHTFPILTIDRTDVTPAMERWHSVGQLEYRRGVPGTETTIQGREGFAQYESKPQAMPFDITYTLSAFDRYETGAQAILTKLLRVFPPVGRLTVFDSLGLERSYDASVEGGIANLQELANSVTRVRGYAVTLRVAGELDHTDSYQTSAVAQVDLALHIKKNKD